MISFVYRLPKVRILLVIGFVMIVCAIFAAIFLNGSGARCLPPSALGVTASDNARILSSGKVRQTELAVLNALVRAGKASPGPSKTYETYLVDDAERYDAGAYCRAKVLDLLFEVVATILAVFAVGFWTARRRV